MAAFLAKDCFHQAKKMRRIKDRGRRKKETEKGKLRTPLSEKAWESSVHKGDLRKSSKEEKHDQSSRSSATTVNHTRAEVQKRETGREAWRGRRES